MQRRAQQLYTRGCQKLRHAGSTDLSLHFFRKRQNGGDERREIERSEYSKGVSDCKECVADRGDASRRCYCCSSGYTGWRAEHLCKVAVFVQAEGHVDGRCGEEFGRAGGDGFGRFVR